MKIVALYFFTLFFIFTFVKQLYDDRNFLREDVEIMEYELMDKDVSISKLQKEVGKLRVELDKSKVKPIKKKKIFIKPKVIDSTEVVLPVIIETINVVDTTTHN
jgi:hypothetical protein